MLYERAIAQMLFVDCTSGLCLFYAVMFFDCNEKGSTPDAVWLQGIGGWRPVWIKFLSVGERMENKFPRKLYTITVIQINKIFNYSSIQWLALPFVQMSLWAHGCSAGPSNSCYVLTESDLVYHYSSRTLHWKGLSAFQCQDEEIWFKTFSGASKQGLAVKLAVYSIAKQNNKTMFYQGSRKASEVCNLLGIS